MEIRGSNLAASLMSLRDQRYRFGLLTPEGDALLDRRFRTIVATPDSSPSISMDEPSTDIELKNDETVDILWRAKDDFGISRVNLVVETKGAAQPTKFSLSTEADQETRLEGRYSWRASDLQLKPGLDVTFYIEAFDNDALDGPKKSVTPKRRLSIFSATKFHNDLLKREQAALDAMVDWLGKELVAPLPTEIRRSSGVHDLKLEEALLARIDKLNKTLGELVKDLRTDKLTKGGVLQAFINIGENVESAYRKREQILSKAGGKRSAQMKGALGAARQKDIRQLERDIVYLDDLLAIQRIDVMKDTAKELLIAQRDLQSMLEEYRQSQDPALRAQLNQQIEELKTRMLELLQKMASVKEKLPGEYRNMESASMMQLGEQLERLEEMLDTGDLDAAAAELEQLANMIENMVDSIDETEEHYGGERYEETRKQLEEFANSFKKLEAEQKSLDKGSQELLDSYRKKSIAKTGDDLSKLIEKARQATSDALNDLDKLANLDQIRGLRRSIENARQRLLDTDALLETSNLSEARKTVNEALEHEITIERFLRNRARRFQMPSPAINEGMLHGQSAAQNTKKAADLLNELFPDSSDVLSPKELQQLQEMAEKQKALEQEARELGVKMQELSQEVPLFGGKNKATLEQATQEMERAGEGMRGGQVPKAATHGQRAASELGKLREALEEAGKQSGGSGLPLPLGGNRGQRREGGQGTQNQDVEIPKVEAKGKGRSLRESLRDASKQDAPSGYQEAVRKYYRELIQ